MNYGQRRRPDSGDKPTDYLTSPVSLKVTSWTHYNEWGEITHNAVLKSGKRELDLVKRYATHDYDAVLGMYYAKARFYDAENRRFAAVDPVKGEITNPLTMVQYIYAIDCPLVYIDVVGERAVSVCVADGGGSTKSTSVKAKASTTAPLSGMVGGALAGLRANITPKVPVPQAPKAVTPKKAANPRRTATASSVVKAAAASAIIGTQKKAPQAPKAKARVLSTHDKAMPPRQYNTPLSCEEFNPYYDSIGDWGAHLWDDIKDAGNEVAGLGKTIWDNQGYWFDRVLNPNDTFDWIYSSANWWTLGTIDSFVRANDARWKAMLSDPSLYTITNYFTLGTTETLGRAISPGSYGVKFFSLEHIISFGSVIAAGYTAGKGYQATHIDPHSTAGLQQISGLPENVAMSQAAMENISSSSQGMTKTVRVGRWMSVEEYQQMLETGRVQVSNSGPMSFVAYPADINAYLRQAKPGTIYVEFDVNFSVLKIGGSEGWSVIPGPGSLYDRFGQAKGLPPITEMPIVTNVKVVSGK